MTQSAVIKTYRVDPSSITEKANQIDLDLIVNKTSNERVKLTLSEDGNGNFTVMHAQTTRALTKKLEESSYQAVITAINKQADRIINRDHWDQAIRMTYHDRIRDLMAKAKLSELSQKMTQIDKESQEIGSPTYTDFFISSDLPGHEKLALVMQHMQATIDAYHFLQLGQNGYKFSKTLEPTSDFYSYFRKTIIDTYRTPEGLKKDALGEKLHLFRSYIDKQAIDYIRDNYKGKTDLDKLIAYTRQKNVKVDYTTGAVLHNRTLGSFAYPANMKVQLPQANTNGDYEVNNARMIEYIVNIQTGQFVSEWNVYRQQADGSYDSNPDHYAIEEGGDVANTESANYGLPKGLNRDVPTALTRTHGYLDVSHPADTDIRRKMTKKWRPAKQLSQGGRYADIVKKGGYTDLERWREIPDEDRLQSYDNYISSSDVGNGFSLFSKHLSKQASSATN